MKKTGGITIVGPGALGNALLQFFINHNYRIHSVWDRSSIHFYDNSSKISDKKRSDTEIEEKDLGSTLILTVPDDQIRLVSEYLSNSQVKWDHKRVIHCSGNLMSDECLALKNRGASVASMHPIQTFTRGDGAEKLENIYISLEGDKSLTSDLTDMIKEMGAHPLNLNPEQKRSVHLAAVIACNYLVTLLSRSEQVLKDAELDVNLNILEPLISQTIVNIFKKGINDSLTGPIARGDITTVEQHLEMIEGNPSLTLIYKILGDIAISISEERDSIDKLTQSKLRNILAIKSH